MNPPHYRNVMEGKDKEGCFRHRLRMVRHAQEYGIRATAKAYGCSRNTVRLWVRRHEGLEPELGAGPGALVEKSRAPHRIPHKTSRAEAEKVIAARKLVSCFGATRLKEWFDLAPSRNAIGRILKEERLTRPKRKKREKQADLREVKARYKALTHLQMDVKYLWDIPQYWPQMTALDLPKYEYTIRDTKSGALFLGFGRQLSVTYASLLIRRCLTHLERYGIEPSRVTVQTDRGGEFSGGQRKKRDFGFVHTVEKVCGAEQVFTPPRWPNANADVEAVHRLIEEELFDLEVFADLEDFLRKATVYQHFFNYARTNSYKGRKTPWDIVQADHAGIPPEILALPPVLLESEFDRIQQVGQDVPGLDGGGVRGAGLPGATGLPSRAL
jgi:transposase